MIETRDSPKEKRPWPIKSEAYPGLRISRKMQGWTKCSFCNQKIVEGEIGYLVYPTLATSGLWIHIGCLDGMYKELNSLRKNNVKKILAEQLCPTIKTADKLE